MVAVGYLRLAQSASHITSLVVEPTETQDGEVKQLPRGPVGTDADVDLTTGSYNYLKLEIFVAWWALLSPSFGKGCDGLPCAFCLSLFLSESSLLLALFLFELRIHATMDLGH
jgi:hypothetical protein